MNCTGELEFPTAKKATHSLGQVRRCWSKPLSIWTLPTVVVRGDLEMTGRIVRKLVLVANTG